MPATTSRQVLALLRDGKPRSSAEVSRAIGKSEKAARHALLRLWLKGVLLRSEKPVFQFSKNFKGRSGITTNIRAPYYYVLRPNKENEIFVDGRRFVAHSPEYEDPRTRWRTESKARAIIDFLRENKDKAFFSLDIVEALKLKNKRISVRDIMTAVRRYERKGMVYVRGYRGETRQTPFQRGFIITWVDESKPRDDALAEAVDRTSEFLSESVKNNQMLERIHQIKDQVLIALKLGEIVGYEYLQNKLRCSEAELKHAIERAVQLYPYIKQVKVFNLYTYLYHASMSADDLRAAVQMKENYIRITQGKMNRLGHNWEAAVEWFIDKFTAGAEFMTQNHREKMDPRRITLHLLRSVGNRKSNAEVDRVWSVSPGPLLQPNTYVLECKWGLVSKRHVDDFFEVLRWSTEFGTDTQEGRALRNGVIGVFAGGALNPREKVNVNGEEISLATYAARRSIQIIKAADLNKRLHERGVKVSLQKICRIAANEREVREILDEVWSEPERSEEIVQKVFEKNSTVYEFEEMLEKGEEKA